MSDGASIAEIKAMLQMRVDELVRQLLPTARIANGYANVGKKGGSFVVYMRGHKVGGWCDFADVALKGDIIDLIAYAQFNHMPPFRSDARRDALKWARGWLGLADMPAVDRERARKLVALRAANREASERERADRARQRAFKMWLAAGPLADGAPALAYLAGRGIDVGGLMLEADLRFTKALEWWIGAERDREGRKLRPGPSFPAIVSAMRDQVGDLRAVHCTFLAPDGSGKAPVDKPKLMWPAVKGTVIRVAKGESGLTPEEAAAAGRRGLVVLTEGIEDALSVAIARPDLRVWACGSLNGIGGAPVLPCVSGFIVAADNDWHSPQAQAGLERAVAQLKAQGVPVSIARSPTGKDFNDCLQGEAR